MLFMEEPSLQPRTGSSPNCSVLLGHRRLTDFSYPTVCLCSVFFLISFFYTFYRRSPGLKNPTGDPKITITTSSTIYTHFHDSPSLLFNIPASLPSIPASKQCCLLRHAGSVPDGHPAASIFACSMFICLLHWFPCVFPF